MRKLAFLLLWAGMYAASAFADAGRDTVPPRIFKSPLAPAPFALLDHEGRAFTTESLTGHWTIAFFGYTSCADICPTTLTALNSVYKQLAADPAAAAVRIVFISVDPHRDTLERLREHMHFFNPAFLGVTGPLAELQRFAWSLGSRFDYRDRTSRKVIANIDTRPVDDDYLVSHMAELFVFNPEGKLAGLIFPPYDVERVIGDLHRIQAEASQDSKR